MLVILHSAVVTSATVLTITLDTTGIAKLEGSAGEGVAGFAASSVGATYPDPDNIDIVAGFIKDDAGNAATTDAATDVAPSYADSAAPTISSFTSTTADGSKGVGDTIDIVATMSEAVVKGSSITVTLNSSSTATAVLTAAANGTTMTGTYTVRSGDSNPDLSVASFVQTSPVTDIYGNVMTSSSLPSTNIADGSALDVDGAPPTSTITAAAYNDTANTITLTGTNFDTIDGGSGGADIKAQLDWTKFTWDIDGDSTATGGTFVVADIASTVVTSATVLTITLDTTGIAKLEGSAGEGVAGFAASSKGDTYPDADNIDIVAGFIKDDAGNAATTDAATDVPPSYSDSAAPTISSFTSTTADGSKGVGDTTIDIVATMSEAVVKGSSITVTLDASSTATAVLTAAANGTTMTGTYTCKSWRQQ